MRFLKIRILGIAFSLLFLSCEEDEVIPDDFTHSYTETQCSDPWDAAARQTNFEQAAIAYLKSKNIDVLESNISIFDGFFCEACHCPTGATLSIKLSSADAKKLMALNEGWISL